MNGQRVVLAMEVAGTPVLESPSWIEQGDSPVFVRDLNVGKAAKPLRMRVAPDKVQVVLVGDGSVACEDGFWVATLPSGAKARILICEDAAVQLSQLGPEHGGAQDLAPLTHGAAARWPTEVVTESKAGPAQGAFVSDEFPLPMENPWNSWMRPGGFDFTPDGKAAVVATWNGDVWRVEGVMDPAPAKLHWRRIASGLFQPLGVKCRGNELFVACRDQLVKLVDLNGDQEIDSYECFNNDHQVTEHFHEFAMGLQTDAEGNFYYMKSAGHAIKGIVPHHGAILKISADGSRTEIVANGLRTSNGMCLAPDGTIYVTDQEGHWTPENRINRIKPGGFYGYMLAYSDVTDPSDDAMEQPVMWIEGAMDRSPAELVWVPEGVWGKLGGGLLSLSYGTGRAYLATQEKCGDVWQGAMCRLPMPAFSSGIMRGRFAADGSLYTCGMVGWASNAPAIGGFYRMRPTGKPAYLPLDVHVRKGGIKLRFSDPLTIAAEGVGAAVMKDWAIKRTENYGSARIGERPLEVTAMRLSKDGCSLDLDIPGIAPADCYELTVNLHGADGEPVSRILQGTIHRLADD
jgi:glucose/arabinose dehydrogenase